MEVIIGCDFHPSYQRVAILDLESGEQIERSLEHAEGEARRFYEGLRGRRVLVGMEACGNSLWFERLLEELGHELWIGDAAKIRAMEVRQQKTDRRDALHLLKLLEQGRFPRLWVPTAEMRDVRQLLWHRHKLVAMRTRVKNELQHLALNQGIQKKGKLWSKAGRKLLEELPLAGWTGRRRQDLLKLFDELEARIGELTAAVIEQARQNRLAQLLETHPGVGPVTALAYVLTIGEVERFARSKQVASYLGLIPRERSSGGRQKYGSISKQGNTFLRTLLVEAAQSAVQVEPELRRAYQRLKQKKHSALARVMIARKLAVRLYWIWKTQKPYTAPRMQSSPMSAVVAR
jgi:transposase